MRLAAGLLPGPLIELYSTPDSYLYLSSRVGALEEAQGKGKEEREQRGGKPEKEGREGW